MRLYLPRRFSIVLPIATILVCFFLCLQRNHSFGLQVETLFYVETVAKRRLLAQLQTLTLRTLRYWAIYTMSPLDISHAIHDITLFETLPVSGLKRIGISRGEIAFHQKLLIRSIAHWMHIQRTAQTLPITTDRFNVLVPLVL